MARAFYAVVCLLVSIPGNAQITLLQSDLPKVGDTLRYFSVNPATQGLNPAFNGPGITWDYSWLTPASAEADTFLAISATNPAYQLFFYNAANHATRTAINIDLGEFDISDAFTFLNTNEDRYEVAGFGGIVGGFPLPVRYDLPEVVMRLPLKYGDTSSSWSRFTMPIPGLATVSRQVHRVNQVDGWGTLIIPTGTYPVLRLKSTLNIVDTIILDMFPFPIPIQTTQTEYRWYAKGGRIPALQITETSGFGPSTVSEVRYSDSITYIPDEHIPPISGFLLLPNPSSSLYSPARILWDQDKEGFVAISAFDMLGRRIVETGMQKYGAGRHAFELPRVAPGQYIVRIDEPENRVTLKWIAIH